ncbi:MAG: PspC domain-containing protein, partial [Actinomycetota bacterium]
MTTGSPLPSAADRPLPRRSAKQRIAGVAGGLGDAIGLDVSLVRIAFAVLALASGAGLVLYLGAWLLMLPPEPDRAGGQVGLDAVTGGRAPVSERPTLALILGGVLLGIGLLVGLMTLDGFRFVPAAIIGLIFAGLVLLNRRSDVAARMLADTGADGLQDPPPPSPFQSWAPPQVPPAPEPPVPQPPFGQPPIPQPGTPEPLSAPPPETTAPETAGSETAPAETAGPGSATASGSPSPTVSAETAGSETAPAETAGPGSATAASGSP